MKLVSFAVAFFLGSGAVAKTIKSELLCSTYLTQSEITLPGSIVHGHRLGERFFIQQLPNKSEPVDLETPFAYLEPFSDMVPAIASQIDIAGPDTFIALVKKSREDLGLTHIGLWLAFNEVVPELARRPDWIDQLHEMIKVSDLNTFKNLAAEINNSSAQILAGYAKKEWQHRKGHILFGLNFAAWRGSVVGHDNMIYSENEESTKKFFELVQGPAVVAAESTYDSYASQGPERAEIVPMVRAQDRSEADQYVRFVVSRYVKPLAYAQLLVSKSDLEPLHVEAAWGELIAELIDRQPGEVIAELGRLHIIFPEEQTNDYFVEQMGEEGLVDKKAYANLVATELLFQKIFSWINSDAKLDKLVVQINAGVERVMLRNGFPLHLGKRVELPKAFEGQRLKEVVYMFPKSVLYKLEEFLLLRVMQRWLQAILDQSYLQEMVPRLVNGRFQIRFLNNEVAGFARTNIYQQIMNKEFVVPEVDENGGGIGIYFGVEQIPEAFEVISDHIESRLLQ